MSVFARATVVSALILVVSGLAGRAEAQPAATVAFPVATVHLERNATDGDFEVVFEVKGAEDGLAELTVLSPDRRTVVAFKAPDSSTLGIRSFRFESPEPTDMKALKAAYPEGVYEFSGRTTKGAKFAGKSTLSHRLAATATLVKPATATASVSVKGLRLAWSPVEGVASYAVGIKQEELNVNLTALLPASSTSFGVPDGFLVPGKKYTLAVGTVTREGNITYVETTFTTEK
ncbi:MAG: hypothetical protein AUH30_03415 [Candidatus Rokubacteria bacterium 13_1_40CM_68_15]|nr:MAG: hypothetical protein AUH30_03415 [Candidatus Rokubacteria bacterium 13_1_40CM_68_15]